MNAAHIFFICYALHMKIFLMTHVQTIVVHVQKCWQNVSKMLKYCKIAMTFVFFAMWNVQESCK